MKFNRYIIILMTVFTTVFTSCMKDNEVILEGSFVEFDAATYNANGAGLTYPILTRVPRYGEPQNNADPAITRASGTIKFRINLVGPHRSTPTTVGYTVLATGTTAVAGTHYTTGNTVTIPANSSFAEIEVQVLNTGTSSSTARDLVLELTGASDLAPSPNEKRLGIRISQL